MSKSERNFVAQDLDLILSDIGSLESHEELLELVDAYRSGDYRKILHGPDAQGLFEQTLDRLSTEENASSDVQPWIFRDSNEIDMGRALLTGLTAFNSFLQANVTGPPLSAQSLLFKEDTPTSQVSSTRMRFLKSLTIDGLSVYQHIPHIELFCLAKVIFTEFFPRVLNDRVYDSNWMRIRINAYYQRLLSSGMSNTRLSDSAVQLQTQIEADILALQDRLLGPGSAFSTESRVQFLLEKTQIYIMQGLDLKARENLRMAKIVSKFSYALSGALGKRTKFQQKEISQLVIFAKSNDPEDSKTNQSEVSNSGSQIGNKTSSDDVTDTNGPVALELNDDTLLESIEFSKLSTDTGVESILPPELAQLQPDEQPQLNALDQIILLTEATLKDTLSPLDNLNSEQVLPYAVRVLNDKPKNWQIYTQALLVRSRIESHRSRTQERSVLQLQVIVDQIIAETQEEKSSGGTNGIPQIQVTSFLPRAKPSESAPITERLKFIYQLNTPTRWEIETELAYAWSTAGSLLSALEIFKRLHLWAEVALCYHSVGQEDKARQIIRRQLYFSSKGPDMDQYAVDAEEVITEKWDGQSRSPPPPHAPRLWCILGDLDQNPECWQRAWDISKSRYARAQRTLGEYFTKKGEFAKAREAYMKATVVNRQNSETWSRLGDIDLRVGNWDGAIIAFQQSIMIDGTDAKTYSNLGSALLSKYTEMMELQRSGGDAMESPLQTKSTEINDLDDEATPTAPTTKNLNPKDILRQSLIAYKRGASIAHSNWQIWDNVITIASRMNPPSHPDILLATRAILRIRTPSIGENAIDIAILRALIAEVTSQDIPPDSKTAPGSQIYTPPRGTLARALLDAIDTDIIPLLTSRFAIYTLIEKLRLWTHDYAAALACAEKAWRMSMADSKWLEESQAWLEVVAATEALVGGLENYGPRRTWVEREGEAGLVVQVEVEVEKQWRAKAKRALGSVLGRARGVWEGTPEWDVLQARVEELRG